MHSWRLVGVGLVAAVALAMAVPASAVLAVDAALRIEPAAVAVAQGATFSVNVVQDAPVVTSGAQASLDFDPRIVHIVSVSPGAAYASAAIFLPADMAADIENANATGRLLQVAAAHTPPGAVPPGAASFLVIQFRVVGCGQTDLTLPAGGAFNAQMISGESATYGQEVPVVTSQGRVTTCVHQDAVTPDASDFAGGGPAHAGIPLGLVGAAGAIALVLVSRLVRGVRRREHR